MKKIEPIDIINDIRVCENMREINLMDNFLIIKINELVEVVNKLNEK